MAKSKNKHGDSAKRKMQNFKRVSISSSHPGKSQSKVESLRKKRKLTDPGTIKNHSQQAWKNKKGAKNSHQQELHQRPVLPYDKNDRILLIGEGDFSFARSLYEHHRCKKVFATCYDPEETLSSKYHGHAEENIKRFLDQIETGPEADVRRNETNPDDTHAGNRPSKPATRRVMYSVDARKLGTKFGGGKDIRRGIAASSRQRVRRDFHNTDPHTHTEQQHSADVDGGPWDIISFNFPHTGGLSTDVNRQVRANQELLVEFFKSCIPLLSKTPRRDECNHSVDEYDTFEDESSEFESGSEIESESEENQTSGVSEKRTIPRSSGQIIVTLFEGEPYTLWNIKDLARHAGLSVTTSFKFPWKSYPGYSHARTLGIVESRSKTSNGDDTEETDNKPRGGGWKGEDREARSFVFEVKSDQAQQRHDTQGKSNRNNGKGDSKRKRLNDSSEDED